MDNREKLCVLVFEESEFSKKISNMNDQILGPFPKCQVALWEDGVEIGNSPFF